MREKICFIAGAGENYRNTFHVNENDMVIAADNGYAYLREMGVKPNVVIGDFDSLKEVPVGENIIKLSPNKDETDMLAAIKVGLQAGYELFHIYGGMGGRTDHTIANIQCLAMLAHRSCQGYMFGDGEIMTVIANRSISFSSDAKGYVSVFSLVPESRGVFEEGLKFPLKNYILNSENPMGVSNEFVGLNSVITVENGTLLIVYTAYEK